MEYSINQQDSVRDQGDRINPLFSQVLDVAEMNGYKLRDSRNYKEQAYYWKTKERGTSDHGQFKIDFELIENPRLGLAIMGSNDCQLPVIVALGVVYDNHVVPMLEVERIKHLSCNFAKLSELPELLKNKLNEFKNLLNNLWNTQINFTDSIAFFQKVQAYKCSLMKCLIVDTVTNATNRLELFLNGYDAFILGKVRATNGKQVKRIRHIRRIDQLTKAMLENLA